MNLNKYALVIKFCIVGGLAFVFNYALLIVLNTHFGIEKIPSEAIAMVLSLQLTFLLHDHWTYVDRVSETVYRRSLRERYLSYLLSNSLGSLITIVMFGVFLSFLTKLPALAFAALMAMVWNFTMNKLVIWKTTKTSSEL